MSQRCSNFMINFLIRMAVGVMLILVINGSLGVPGVALLYGVAFYESR